MDPEDTNDQKRDVDEVCDYGCPHKPEKIKDLSLQDHKL